MKKRLLAVCLSVLLSAANAVYASADYDYNYDGYTDYSYDYNADDTYADYGYYDDTQQYGYAGYDTSSEEASSIDPTENYPTQVRLDATPIVDNAFSAQLKIDSRSLVTSADLTITYDAKTLKLTKSSTGVTPEGVTSAAAETEPGVIQFQYANPAGSDGKSAYLTLDFEVTDLSERTTLLYININSLMDNTNTEMTATSDGTIIRIMDSVEVDPSADESMYSELKLPLIGSPITFEQLGLTDVASISIEDQDIASADSASITPLTPGLTNMVISYNSGAKKYFRLVVSDPYANKSAAENNSSAAQPSVSAVPQITVKETDNSLKIRNIVIYFLVLAAIAAIFIEFFVIVGNPYAKTAEAIRRKRAREEAEFDEEYDTIPESDFEQDDDEYEDEEYSDEGNDPEEADMQEEEEGFEVVVEADSDEADGEWSEELGEDDDGSIDEFYRRLDSGLDPDMDADELDSF